ncbi:hypothetical protein Dform_01673 [Dehalogenimonas formicexedens]|uniref:NYN domain-containing protein n=1 Tax=Dehalogenimonas formicexedens TaxID=1839801 RepID=A0A1P8F952_9CHLR|nr:NYN domain-containing protein [Dehalogenimonas formicexedens]APV44994.1 hypothetical protein Dform_01673 [Dehalogenimonas formicexedens]
MADKEERVMIFVDGSNMYHSLKAYFHRTDIDLGKFCEKLVNKRKLVRIYYYNAEVGQTQEPERYKDQRAFFDSVEAIPYTELRLGRLVYTNAWPNTPPYEKGVDVMLATDMLTHCFKNNYDTAILVAGDADFVGALQAVKDNGKHCEAALFGEERTSVPLRKVADVVHIIDGNLMRGCWKTPPPPPRPQRQFQHRHIRPPQGQQLPQPGQIPQQPPATAPSQPTPQAPQARPETSEGQLQSRQLPPSPPVQYVPKPFNPNGLE